MGIGDMTLHMEILGMDTDTTALSFSFDHFWIDEIIVVYIPFEQFFMIEVKKLNESIWDNGLVKWDMLI